MKRTPRNKGNTSFKPLCDCVECTCNYCPDILKLLSISLDEPECNNSVKGKKKISQDSRKDKSNSTNSLRKEANKLDGAEDNQSKKDCVCETIARSLSKDIPNSINQNDFNKEYINGHFSKNIK